jgi:hypothetical protein
MCRVIVVKVGEENGLVDIDELGGEVGRRVDSQVGGESMDANGGRMNVSCIFRPAGASYVPGRTCWAMLADVAVSPRMFCRGGCSLKQYGTSHLVRRSNCTSRSDQASSIGRRRL